MRPSPRFFTSWPPRAVTASRRRRKWARRMPSAASSPIRLSSSVDPTRSVKRRVTVPSTGRSAGDVKRLVHPLAQQGHPETLGGIASRSQKLSALPGGVGLPPRSRRPHQYGCGPTLVGSPPWSLEFSGRPCSAAARFHGHRYRPPACQGSDRPRQSTQRRRHPRRDARRGAPAEPGQPRRHAPALRASPPPRSGIEMQDVNDTSCGSTAKSSTPSNPTRAALRRRRPSSPT